MITIRKPYEILWIAFLLCLFPNVSTAQNKAFVRGIITDQSNGLPIEGVNIRVQNTYSGSTTNAQGVFTLRPRNLPAILLVTHIAYFGRQIIVTQSQSDSLRISLSPKPIELEEAEITEEKYKVFKGKHQEVIDYNFLDTNIIILAYNFNKNRHELIVTNEQFDTLSIKDVSFIRKPRQIFKDCMGSCHLFSKDTAYQIYFADSSIYLLYPTQLQKLNTILGNCLFETPAYFAFEGNADKSTNLNYAARNLSDLPNTRPGNNDKWKHLFYLINKKTHEKTILDQVYEWEKKRDAYNHAMYVFSDSNNRMFFGELLRCEEMMFFMPAFQTLKLLNDTIYYFNHLKSRIEIYSEDLALQDTIHIDYHNRKNWKPFIITDQVKHKAYTFFTVGAKLMLSAIDLKSGSVREVHKIDKLFPSKVKVKNGYLYFLYNDVNNVWGTRKLFQGELSY